MKTRFPTASAERSPGAPLMHAAGTVALREWRQHAFVREAALAAVAALTYFGVRNLTVGDAAEAFSNADRLARLEHQARIAWERPLQDVLLSHDALVTMFNWIYIWGHWPVIITAAIMLFRTRPERYLLLRNAMFLSGAIGFLFFALLPVAPPRLVDPSLIDTVTLHSDSYRALQPPGLTNQYAAFPSLHFGWNLLVGIAVWGATRNVLLRLLSILGPAAMAVAVVVTANHYVIDPVGGMAVVLFALWVVSRRYYSSQANLCRVTFVVAHRAGNDLTRLQEAEQLGVALVEADVRLWRGRLEVRHLKTVGPLPILWDRWRLANPFAPRLELRDLLAGARSDTELLLDLKGRDARLAELVLDALPSGRRVTVCARSRNLLEPFAGREHMRLFQSVGSRRQLRALLRTVDALVLDGVSVHERLLDERVVAALRRRSSTVMSWPVNSLQRAHELALLGVQGLISDRPSLILERSA